MLPDILVLIFTLCIVLLSNGMVLGAARFKKKNPDIVIIQLGFNNLTSKTALRIGSSIDDFVMLLHNVYHVKVICVCQTIMRQDQSAFNRKAKLLTRYLQVVLEPVPYAYF